jgi:hypothetical protein
MANEADNPTLDRFLEVYLLWLFGVGAVLRLSGRVGVEVPAPLGFRPPVFQFATTNIPSSSTPHMFQIGFDGTTENQLGWDEFGYGDILATMDAPQQAEEVGPSQLTQAPVGTQPTQPLRGATPAAGGATPDAAGSSQAVMATPSHDQLGPRVVRAPDP